MGYPVDLQSRIDSYLKEVKFSYADQTDGLIEAMRYSLLAGGKRVRPVLALATAKAVGSDSESVLPVAAALEMIHTYSLIHDDLPAMDDDDLRRGMPTCHKVYGEHVAILAGDALYAEAIGHVLSHQQGDAQQVLAAVKSIVSATGVNGMVGGQYLDVAEASCELRHIHELKTGRLIEASVGCVLELTALENSAKIKLSNFAKELGVLFQIVDDILDVVGDQDALGKPTGSDQRQQKRTYVSEHGLDGARSMAQSTYQSCCSLLDGLEHSHSELKQITDFIYTRTS